jgi:hypothetical protein
LPFGLLDDMNDVFLLPDIAFERSTFDRRGNRFRARQVEIGDHHLGRSGTMKGFTKCPSDAVGATGDDHDLAGYLHRIIRIV